MHIAYLLLVLVLLEDLIVGLIFSYHCASLEHPYNQSISHHGEISNCLWLCGDNQQQWENKADLDFVQCLIWIQGSNAAGL